MSKYIVVKYFTDLKDGSHAYNVGDEFPREGVQVNKKRLNELMSNNNRQGTPLIKKVVEKSEPIAEPITEAPSSDAKPKKSKSKKRGSKE